MNVTFVEREDVDNVIRERRRYFELSKVSHYDALYDHYVSGLHYAKRIEQASGVPHVGLLSIIDGALTLSADVPNLNIYHALDALGVVVVDKDAH